MYDHGTFMPRIFTHLVLTRFNTAVTYAPSAKRLDDDWLANRLELFERYCLPSMQGQSSEDFTWLVFFDADSPGWFRNKIASFAPLVCPVYVSGPLTDTRLADEVRATGRVKGAFLITTRLDNDDALGVGYIAEVQAAFREQDREFIEFPFGLQSFHEQLYSVYWPSNPFLSLVERVGPDGSFTTVFCVAHDRVREAGKVHSIRSSPQWLQVLHGSNLLNSLRGWPRLLATSHPNFSFPLTNKTTAESLARRTGHSARAYFRRAMTRAARRIR